MTEPFLAYWGKAGDDGACHRLPYHGLDVAACGVTLLRHLPRWRARLEAVTGMAGEALETAVQVLFSLHDLGKFATAFQNLRPDLLERLQGRASTKRYATRHDTLGWRLWHEYLQEHLLLSSGRRRRTSAHPGLDAWLRAVIGHHGQPPEERESWRGQLEDHFDPGDREAAAAFVNAVLRLAGRERMPCPPEDTARTASWWLAGFAVVADWLGSNRDFFPYRDAVIPLEDYWRIACEQAGRAVAAAGLDTDPPAERFTLTDCFAAPPPRLTPTPLQRWAETTELGEGPHLFILEDVTGAGKTEAALLLAQRLLRHQGGGGLYFGLPTMATANGMYQRLGAVYRRLFAPGSNPSLVLAHSRADQVAAFRASVLPPPTPEADYGDDTEPAGARCSAWLADNRKKALLAEAGVGTVDQGLLAVLASRHQSLRLLGLLDKVLIVDEVHACDAYMNRLLAHLIRAHARAGGSTILLSATLPQRQRRDLLTAFAEGAGLTIPESAAAAPYPLATRLSRQGYGETPLVTRPEVQRRVDVTFVEDEAAVEARLAEAVRAGRCACWIRNTVDAARRSFEGLRERHPDWSVDLFHARFTLADRLAIEQRVLARFGKDSGPEARRGQVLIATQVVEQSLDLDFDLLISDLAPIDLLIQRAGRLQRHPRDRDGRPIDGPDRRGTAELVILAPPWDDEPPPRWLRAVLPGTAAVYEAEDGRLWQAMKLLRERGGFTMPDDARHLVEGVYGLDPFDFPEGLQEKSLEASGLERGKASIAEDKVLHLLEDSYRLDGPWLDEDSAPTRLGEPTTTVWLARLENDRLRPLHGGCADDPGAWMQSALTLSRNRIGGEVIPAGTDADTWQRLKAPLPGKGKWGVVVVLERADPGWTGQARDGQGAPITLGYDPREGLKWLC